MSLCPFLLSKDLFTNTASLGTAQVPAYWTFLTRELFCNHPLSWVLNREGWLLSIFWLTIENLLITIYKPCCCTYCVKYIWKPPAVQHSEVWGLLCLPTSSVQSQGRCHCDFWRTHSQTWWQWHPLCHSSAWNKLCCSLFGKDGELFSDSMTLACQKCYFPCVNLNIECPLLIMSFCLNAIFRGSSPSADVSTNKQHRSDLNFFLR